MDASSWHTVARKKDCSVWTFGRNDHGQLGDNSRTRRLTPVKVKGIEEVVEVSAGSWHTVVRKKDGSVWTFG